MQQNFTIADAVAEELAVPPGASVYDLRAGAWVDEEGCLAVRNVGQPGDRCEQCGQDIADDLMREFRTYREGTNGRAWHPDGHTVVSCFDIVECDGRAGAKEFGGVFPPEVCCTQFEAPSYHRWASDQVSLPAVFLDRWFPSEYRSLALAGRTIAIWANGEVVTQITNTTVSWKRPLELHGARGEYIEMFAAAAHGLALLEVARALDPDRKAYPAFGELAAFSFARKKDLFARYRRWFWEQPVRDAVASAVEPLILTDTHEPTQLLRDVAHAIDDSGCTLDAASALRLRAGLDIPRVEAVNWRVGLHSSYETSTGQPDPDDCTEPPPALAA